MTTIYNMDVITRFIETQDEIARIIKDDADARISTRDQVTRFLLEQLREGPVLHDVIKKAAKLAGIAEQTLTSVKRELRIESVKERVSGESRVRLITFWKLPAKLILN